ncbi:MULTISPECIES: alpha/beta family hydrolase [Alphaproteobacteria]|nr:MULTISPECIES: alpha/beta family hydrolase [Alphaproteobacteria]
MRPFKRRSAARLLKRGKAIYLAGDSFPADLHIEAAIEARLPSLFGVWRSQTALNERHGAGQFTMKIPERLDILRRELPDISPAWPNVLVGRSSGSRVATLFACEHPVCAVVCLGYPFKHPNREPEPIRYEHLRHIAVPTLILQGRSDAYGSFEQAGTYPASANVTIMPVDTDHEFRLDENQWDAVAGRIAHFLRNL